MTQQQSPDAAPLDMDQVRIDPSWALRLPGHLATRRKLLPFAQLDGEVCVACADPNDLTALRAVQRFLNAPVRAERAEPQSLARAITRVFGEGAPNRAAGDQMLRQASIDLPGQSIDLDAESATAICDELLYAAILRQASDIHIEPREAGFRTRLRVDGVVEAYRELPRSAFSGVVGRFKVLAGLDIAEKRAPQDGSFRHEVGNQRFDVRVATLPTPHGERMTLRLLPLRNELLSLEKLGMSTEQLELFRNGISRPHGLILLSGPTGSGKSTTLYASLGELLASRTLNVITIEDPIEYTIDGVTQVQVDAADKVNFTKALRSLLRHDPDVVMIGEIRDAQTADVAIKAALTGHLVFSTLHTNSAVGVCTRLIDMGVPPYLVAATLRLTVAQRLVRRLCVHCREPVAITADQAAALGDPTLEGQTAYEPRGCMYCGNQGYVGRIALMEMLPVDEQLSRTIADGADEGRILESIRQRHLRTLRHDGIEKIKAGHTSIQEVLNAVTDW